MYDPALVIEQLEDVLEALDRVPHRFAKITAPEDFLEVLFSKAPGYMRETGNDAVMERVDASGNLLGFSVINVSALPKNMPSVGTRFRGFRYVSPTAFGGCERNFFSRGMLQQLV